MGRTIASFRQIVNAEYSELDKFKRALSKRDREALEELMTKARAHSAAGTYAGFADPTMFLVLGMLIEIDKKTRELDARTPR